MRLYGDELKEQIRSLRKKGYTYTEIQSLLKIKIPKGSLNYICKGITLTPAQMERVYQVMREGLVISRQKAVLANRAIFENKIKALRDKNEYIKALVENRGVLLTALAMLYLGEGSKWQSTRRLTLASSDPVIIRLYIDLLFLCYKIRPTGLHVRIQHRADQSSSDLVNFWSKFTKIPKTHFYKCYIDKRTIGQKTKKANYYGVCTISCAGTHIQLELAEIADIISVAVRGISAAG